MALRSITATPTTTPLTMRKTPTMRSWRTSSRMPRRSSAPGKASPSAPTRSALCSSCSCTPPRTSSPVASSRPPSAKSGCSSASWAPWPSSWPSSPCSRASPAVSRSRTSAPSTAPARLPPSSPASRCAPAASPAPWASPRPRCSSTSGGCSRTRTIGARLRPTSSPRPRMTRPSWFSASLPRRRAPRRRKRRRPPGRQAYTHHVLGVVHEEGSRERKRAEWRRVDVQCLRMSSKRAPALQEHTCEGAAWSEARCSWMRKVVCGVSSTCMCMNVQTRKRHLLFKRDVS
mmetsp:Transcript_9832/g.28889  ORF Transcript_9832/g.28889 Transcript_9832/m.28889 type:complete len:288 (-) Transcript_9832:58-921(-)